jgi:hypothetical protein
VRTLRATDGGAGEITQFAELLQGREREIFFRLLQASAQKAGRRGKPVAVTFARLTHDSRDAQVVGSLQLSLTSICLMPATKFERILRIGPLGSALG